MEAYIPRDVHLVGSVELDSVQEVSAPPACRCIES